MDFLISETPRIEKFEYAGKRYEVEVKDLSWTQKNSILSKATKIDKQGNASFDIDIFNRDALHKILGNCKVIDNTGKETVFRFDATMLLGIKADFGAILEKFLPSPVVEITKEEEKK